MISFQIKKRVKRTFFTNEKALVQEAIYNGTNGVSFKAVLFLEDDALNIQLTPISDKVAHDSDVANFLIELQKKQKSKDTLIPLDVSKKWKIFYHYKQIEISIPFSKKEISETLETSDEI